MAEGSRMRNHNVKLRGCSFSTKMKRNAFTESGLEFSTSKGCGNSIIELIQKRGQ